MAFFKFRLPGRDAGKAAVQAPPESVETLRRRARHRLIGAAVLVLIGVVGFPLLFDTQPRPVAVDIPIEIPDKAQAKPLAAPASPAVATAPSSTSPSATSVQSAPVAAAPSSPASTSSARAVESRPVEAARPAETPRPVETVRVFPTAPAAPQPAKPATTSATESARAQALLEGKRPTATVSPPSGASAATTAATPAASSESGRFVVQVGAFSEESKARDARMKLERAGLKTYTQVVDTKDGKRIRVRVGPFAGRAEADRAANRIKGLDLPAAILTL